MKLALAIMALALCSLGGYAIGRRYSRRAEFLRDMERVIRSVRLVSMTTGDKLEAQFIALSADVSETASKFLMKYVELTRSGETSRASWDEALDGEIGGRTRTLGLTGEDLDLLRQIGRSIGGMLEGQREALAIIAAELSLRRAEAESAREKFMPMCVKLGLIAGLAAVIFII